LILSEIAAYLREHRRSTISDLSARFRSDPGALRPMLDALERKGRVRRVAGGASCGGGCVKCSPESLDIYEWAAGIDGRR
jgi:hypothetical protein